MVTWVSFSINFSSNDVGSRIKLQILDIVITGFIYPILSIFFIAGETEFTIRETEFANDILEWINVDGLGEAFNSQGFHVRWRNHFDLVTADRDLHIFHPGLALTVYLNCAAWLGAGQSDSAVLEFQFRFYIAEGRNINLAITTNHFVFGNAKFIATNR